MTFNRTVKPRNGHGSRDRLRVGPDSIAPEQSVTICNAVVKFRVAQPPSSYACHRYFQSVFPHIHAAGCYLLTPDVV